MIREEAAALVLTLVGLVAAAALATGVLRLSTSDGRAHAAAERIRDHAQRGDLVVVDPALGRGSRDLGRILFPFRPHLALAHDNSRVALGSFPFQRALLVGDFDASGWTGGRPERPAGAGLRIVELDQPQRSLLRLVDYTRVRIGADDGERRCGRPHHSGGVACGAAAWHYVGPIVASLGGAQTMCLWTHPPQLGLPLQLDLAIPQALRPPGAELQVRLNFIDEVRGERRRAPVQLEVFSAGGEPAQVACTNREGSCGVQVPAVERVTVAVASADNGRQLVCLTGSIAATGDARGAQ